MKRLSRVLERWQRRVAGYLNGRMAGVRGTRLRALLALFCVVSGSAAVYVGWNGVRDVSAFVAAPVKVLAIPKSVDGSLAPTGCPLSAREQNSLCALRGYLDSLQATASGRQVYDSLARVRSGLLDSLAFLEKMCSGSLKTK